jgi:hypothetical protein
MLTLLDEAIVHLVYGKCNPFVMVGLLCATWHRVIPKLIFKIQTFLEVCSCHPRPLGQVDGHPKLASCM